MSTVAPRRALVLGTYLDPGWTRLARSLDVDLVVARVPELLGCDLPVLPAPPPGCWAGLGELLATTSLICGPGAELEGHRLPTFSSVGPAPSTLWEQAGTPIAFDGRRPRVLVVLFAAHPLRRLLAALRTWSEVVVVAPGLRRDEAARIGSPSVRVLRELPRILGTACDLLVTDLPAPLAGDFLHRRIPVVSLRPTLACASLPRNPGAWEERLRRVARSVVDTEHPAVEDALPALLAALRSPRAREFR